MSSSFCFLAHPLICASRFAARPAVEIGRDPGIQGFVLAFEDIDEVRHKIGSFHYSRMQDDRGAFAPPYPPLSVIHRNDHAGGGCHRENGNERVPYFHGSEDARASRL